jgi:hypothetical protein
MLFGWTIAIHCGNHRIYKYCTITEQITVCLHRNAGSIHTGTIQLSFPGNGTTEQSFPGNSSLLGRYAILTGEQLRTLTAYTGNQPESASLNLTVTLTQLTKFSTTISTVLTTTVTQSVNHDCYPVSEPKSTPLTRQQVTITPQQS